MVLFGMDQRASRGQFAEHGPKTHASPPDANQRSAEKPSGHVSGFLSIHRAHG